jgi:hypothetical protein
LALVPEYPGNPPAWEVFSPPSRVLRFIAPQTDDLQFECQPVPFVDGQGAYTASDEVQVVTTPTGGTIKTFGFSPIVSAGVVVGLTLQVKANNKDYWGPGVWIGVQLDVIMKPPL